jgi:hypothetical protein
MPQGGNSQQSARSNNNGQDIPDESERQDDNPIEFVDDSCERNQNAWLRFPIEFIRPAKMCSVNKFVQCVDESFLHHSMHHVPTGPEYVLIGHDSPSLPQHFFKWIWAMSQINCMQQYTGCVVPVVALTEVNPWHRAAHSRAILTGARPPPQVAYTKKGKDLVATNIQRRLVISQAWQIDDLLRYEQGFPDMDRRESIMMQSIQELRQGESHYANILPIQLLWGVIPVEYTLNGVQVRRIFHVLKTIPAPGFDLMRCLVDIGRKRDQRMRSGTSYGAVSQAVHEVINYECNRNMNIVGFFGRSHPLPHPCDVMDSVGCPMNPQRILSPFLVMRKILIHLPVAELSNLVIDGFPKTDTLQQRQGAFQFFDSMQRAYCIRLKFYHQVFDTALQSSSGQKTSTIEPVALPLVLCTGQDECIDNVHCYMNMTFNLGNTWLDNGATSLDRAELLRLPQLAVATLTPFQYVTVCDASPSEFIRAHIGHAGDDVDETKLQQKYSMDNGSWGDMPHAAMYRSARDSFRSSMKTMQDGGVDVGQRITAYHSFVRAQSTIHSQAVLVDLMMSDRVLHCAQCLDRLSGRINVGVREALNREVPGQEASSQRKYMRAYPDTAYFLRLMHVLSLHNKHIRANAVNLTTLWAIMVSDVLTHLGSHHETWNWMMYTVQVWILMPAMIGV